MYVWLTCVCVCVSAVCVVTGSMGRCVCGSGLRWAVCVADRELCLWYISHSKPMKRHIYQLTIKIKKSCVQISINEPDELDILNSIHLSFKLNSIQFTRLCKCYTKITLRSTMLHRTIYVKWSRKGHLRKGHLLIC